MSNAKRSGPATAKAVSSPDVLAVFAGPVATIAASVPKKLANAVRAEVGKRGFSRFVSQALARELLDRNRAAYVAGMEAIHGPVDAKLVAEYEEMLGR